MSLQSSMKRSSGRSVVVSFVLLVLLLSFFVRSTFRLRKQQHIKSFLDQCSLGSTRVLEMIDKEPGLLNAFDESGWNCLINASKYNRLELVRALLIRGASTGTESMQHSALRGAALFGYNDVVNALIEAGALVDVFSAHRRTPLMGAAMNGHKQVVQTLLRAGALLTLKNDDGQTALDLATEKEHREIVQLLASEAEQRLKRMTNVTL